MTEDILSRIEQAIGCQYQPCGKDLGPSPSSDFCSELCQARWHAIRSSPLPPSKPAGRAALLQAPPVRPAGRGYSADLVIIDEVTSMAGQIADAAAEMGATAYRVYVNDLDITEQVQAVSVQPDPQRGWLARWFRRHR